MWQKQQLFLNLFDMSAKWGNELTLKNLSEWVAGCLADRMRLTELILANY